MAEALATDNIIERRMPRRKRRVGRTIFIVASLAWPILHFLVFWLYINFDTILLSFQRMSLATGEYTWYGANNYINFFETLFKGYPTKMQQQAVWNSLAFLPWNTVVLLPISLIAAYVLYKKVLLANAFRVIFFLPSLISIVVLTMLFKFSFDSTIGFVNPLLRVLGLDKVIPIQGWFGSPSTAFGMILAYCLWAGVGYNIVLVTGAIMRIPIEIIESAKLDGIGFFREFWSITLPLIAPTINTMIILGSSAVFTIFLQPMLLTSGGPDNSTYTINYLITASVQAGSLTSAATQGVFFSIIGVPFILILRFIVDKLLPAVEY